MRPKPYAVAALLSISAALAATDALAQQAELRRENRIGVGFGPTAAWLPEPGKAIFGVSTAFAVSLPLTSVVDFRGALVGDASGNRETFLSLGAPVSMRFHIGSWYSAAVGLVAGMATDTKNTAVYLGPEWSVATLRFGALRQFELDLTQGFHLQVSTIHGTPRLGHFQSSLLLTYFFVEPAPARGSS